MADGADKKMEKREFWSRFEGLQKELRSTQIVGTFDIVKIKAASPIRDILIRGTLIKF